MLVQIVTPFQVVPIAAVLQCVLHVTLDIIYLLQDYVLLKFLAVKLNLVLPIVKHVLLLILLIWQLPVTNV
jgi:hypothetical protein